MAATFSEWRSLPLSLSELCINTTLRCGQSFRWHHLPENGEWRCVLYGRLLSLRQDSNNLYYRTYYSSPSAFPSPPASEMPSRVQPDTESGQGEDIQLRQIIKHYFHLSSNLTELYTQWSSQDPNFRRKAAQFTGIRILRQDAWEALVSFICSSNNNIARISQMVEKLCVNYGPLVATVDGRAYHDFPTPKALATKDVEGDLRSLGFGYRAKYIYHTAVIVSQEREEGWLHALSNPESPPFGVEAKTGDAMKPEGRQGYRDAHEKLLGLQGVGPKVADCVCLMGLGWGESVPVDTHVWQIAQRDYRFGKASHKSLTKATYDAIGNHFRKLWGQEAGWAHSVLFTADLRSFADRLAATKKVTAIKDSREDVKVKTEVITSVALTAPERADLDVKVEGPEIEPAMEVAQSKKRKVSPDGTTIHTFQTVETRRMSKRLRR